KDSSDVVVRRDTSESGNRADGSVPSRGEEVATQIHAEVGADVDPRVEVGPRNVGRVGPVAYAPPVAGSVEQRIDVPVSGAHVEGTGPEVQAGVERVVLMA